MNTLLSLLITIIFRIPFIPYSLKSKLFSLSKKEINSNGLILHGGGPIYSNGTIKENECHNPLELDPKDPNFIEKTCGGLKLVDNDPMIQTAKYPEKAEELTLKLNNWIKDLREPKWDSNADVSIPINNSENSKTFYFPW